MPLLPKNGTAVGANNDKQAKAMALLLLINERPKEYPMKKFLLALVLLVSSTHAFADICGQAKWWGMNGDYPNNINEITLRWKDTDKSGYVFTNQVNPTLKNLQILMTAFEEKKFQICLDSNFDVSSATEK